MMKDTLANISRICRIAQTHTAVNPHWRTVFEVHPEIATRVPASEDGYLTDEADVNFLIAYLSQLTPIVLLNERVVYGEDSTRTASGVHRYFGDMKSYLLEQLSAFYLTGSRNPPSSIALFWLSATVSKLDGYVAYLDSYGVVYETIKTSQSAVFPSQETRDRYKELLVNQFIFSSDTVFNPRNSDPQIIPYYTYNDLAFRFEYKRFNTLSFSMAPAIHFDSLTVPNAEAMLAQLAPIQLLLNPNDPSYYNYIYQEDQRTEHEEIELYGRVRDEVEINFTMTPSADRVLCAGKDTVQFSDTVNMTGFADTGSPVTASFNKLPEAPELGAMDVNMTYYSCFPGRDVVFGSDEVTCNNIEPQMDGYRYGGGLLGEEKIPNEKHLMHLDAGIRINGDDDNHNSSPDYSDNGPVDNENDLIKVTVRTQIPNLGNAGNYVMKRTSNKINVYWLKDKKLKLLKEEDEAAFNFGKGLQDFYVEHKGTQGESATLEFRVKKADGTYLSYVPSITFTPFTSIVVGLSGELTPANATTLDPLANGMYDVSRKLQRKGYDVYYYDEKSVESNGSGQVFDDVVAAIKGGGVSNVAIYGHSHGGGATYALAEKLSTASASIGAFSIRYTAYVDAIQNESNFDNDPEVRLPPGTLFHVNLYERKTLGLRGDLVPGANFNSDVNQQGFGLNVGHGGIDNHPKIIDFIVDTLTLKTPK